ncbi:MAG: hypothetical protein AB7P40_15105 [Chloroflexota bacterium]
MHVGRMSLGQDRMRRPWVTMCASGRRALAWSVRPGPARSCEASSIATQGNGPAA